MSSEIHISGKRPSPWMWIFLCVAVLSASQCTQHDTQVKSDEKARLDQWQESPEFAFRWCLSTVAGTNGTATPEQIRACKETTEVKK